LPTIAIFCIEGDRAQIELQKVLVHNGDVFVWAQMLFEQRDESTIDLDGDDAPRARRYLLGERADPRADLEHRVFGGELSRGGDLL
jgi:hypothetical protein